jgi:signal transduction histidine kinase
VTWLPRSLFGRIALVLLAGLVVAHVLTFWWIVRSRSELSEAMMQAYVGRDVASSVAILDRVPPEERASWLARLARHNYRYELALLPGGTPLAAGRAPQIDAIVAGVASELGAARVQGLFAGPVRDGVRELWLRLRLADGAPLTLVLAVPGWMPSWSSIAVLTAQLAALLVVTWLAVRLATRPLSRLAEAADRFGQDLRAPALAESGPQEVTRAAAAFNAMRARIGAALDERLRILAAIAHDLRTPLTRMQLRSEMLPDPELRERLQSDLAEMQGLVEEGIEYARTAHAAVEPERPVDLHALLDSLCFDYQDAGRRVHWSGKHETPLRTRPQALRRIVVNLVDNALRFAGEAEIALESAPRQVIVAVRDRGPGIAQAELERVLEPFVRLDDSRSRETGGAGLGLAIAHELAGVLGGALQLRNREGGGLEARLVLPSGSS